MLLLGRQSSKGMYQRELLLAKEYIIECNEMINKSSNDLLIMKVITF